MENKRFKILMTVSEGMIARNLLYAGVVKDLIERGSEVFVIAPSEKSGFYESEFPLEHLHFYAYPKPITSFKNRLINYLGRNGLKTHTILTDQSTKVLSDKRYLSYWVKHSLTRLFGASPLFHAFIRFMAARRDIAQEMEKLFSDIHPDCVWATDVYDQIDLDVLALAKKKNVRTIGMVRSWDNLTTHGITQIKPERLMVWNEFLKGKALKHHEFLPQEVLIVGTPHYDLFVEHKHTLTRSEFLAQYGFPPDSKLILVAGIGSFLAPHETDIAIILSRAIDAGELPKDAVVLFRPHPHFSVNKEAVEGLSHAAFDTNIARYLTEKTASWEMDLKKTSHYIDSLRFADVVITTASTVTIDAVVLGRPVICIAFDGLATEPYLQSVKRFYEVYTHYRDIGALGGYERVESAEELTRAVGMYLAHPETHEDGRKRILKEFGGPIGHAGKTIADTVLSFRT